MFLFKLECNSICKECSLTSDNCTVCYNSSIQLTPSCECADGYYNDRYYCLSKIKYKIYEYYKLNILNSLK